MASKYQRIAIDGISSIVDYIIYSADCIKTLCGQTYSYGADYHEEDKFGLSMELKSSSENFDVEMNLIVTGYEINSINRGITMSYRGAEFGMFQIKNTVYEFSKSQKEHLFLLLKECKDYKMFIDSARWYSRNEAIKRLGELFSDDVIEWEEYTPEEIDARFYEIEGCVTAYKAEFGDALFQYQYINIDAYKECIEEEREYDEEDEINLEDYSCGPRLIISVEDYYVGYIENLTDEELSDIGFMVGDEDNEEIEGEDFDYEYESSADIGFEDVVVKTASANCMEKGHLVDRVKASVNIIRKSTMEMEIVSINAYYCRTCHRYYILEAELDRIALIGLICCRVVDISEFIGNRDRSDWAEESVIKQYGYSVSKVSGLTTKERHAILDFIIGCEIMPKSRVINHIEWLVKQNSGRRTNMVDAINKWNDDLIYLHGETVGQNIKIRRILTK